MQSMIIITKVVNRNPTHAEVYSIKLYVIKFVNELRKVGNFPPGTPVFSTNNSDQHVIAGKLLKVALSTMYDDHNSNPLSAIIPLYDDFQSYWAMEP